MRDPKRINVITKKLKELWKFYPDQRFLQLFTNYILPEFQYDILFYIEDNKFEKVLDEAIKNVKYQKTKGDI